MTKNQRLIVLLLLLVVLTVLFTFQPTSPKVTPPIHGLLLSSLVLMSFSALLLEHFFARPTDVLAAATSILLLLVPSRQLLSSWGMWYWIFFFYEIGMILLATTALLLLTDKKNETSLRNRASQVLKTVAVRLGPGRLQYFWLFFLTLLFFVHSQTIPFLAFAIYAALIMISEPQKLAFELPRALRTSPIEIGEIFGVQGRNTFLVRLHPSENRPSLRFSDLLEFTYSMDEPPKVRRGLILERFFLDQAQWIRVLCHEEIDSQTEELAPLSSHRRDAVYRRVEQDAGEYLGSLVGVVRERTEVGTLRFLQAGRATVQEGDLIEVRVKDRRILYQIVNGRVAVEALESRNEADLVIGEAAQLGEWNQRNGIFSRFGWVPGAWVPVTKAGTVEPPTREENEIELGRIPGTDFPVLLDRRKAISHHTAILGVTGVGKSVLARHLLRELLEDDLRVIVVDFTREWKDRLSNSGVESMFDSAASKPLFEAIEAIKTEEGKFKNQQNPDLIASKKKVLFDGFQAALSAFLAGDEQIRVFELPDLSNTESVLEYTQWFFKTLFHLARDQKTHNRRICIVLEEAHTVVPEWNFIGLHDKSSQALVNNISQIALQGRKYGVGFIVIAQRTASVSKTVLTQCNTMIAFQCFDNTSIEFLSNYLPEAVAKALPNLRFRQAVAVGKAVRGSVPLIFEVPLLTDQGLPVEE